MSGPCDDKGNLKLFLVEISVGLLTTDQIGLLIAGLVMANLCRILWPRIHISQDSHKNPPLPLRCIKCGPARRMFQETKMDGYLCSMINKKKKTDFPCDLLCIINLIIPKYFTTKASRLIEAC